MVRALLIGLVLLVLPSSAAAAPFGVLPFRATGGATACLEPTGKGSELVRWVRDAVKVLEARADGLRPTDRLALGRYWTCPVVASDPNGAAVPAVGLLDEEEYEFSGLRVALREPGAAGFSAPVTLPIKRFQDVDVAVSPRGDAIITWLEYTADDDKYDTRVRAVRRAPGGTFGAIRDAWGFSPLALADGRFAVAWSDDRERFADGPHDGRLHLAVEGVAAAPVVPPPTVTVGKPNRRALRPAQPLLLPVRCSAACDVRVLVPGQPDGAGVTGSLARAGTMTLRLRPLNRALAPRRGGLRLTLQTSAPAARAVQRQHVSLAVRRLPAPPLPRVLDLRARRSGNDLVVCFRIDRPLVDAFLFVIGSRTRNLDDGDAIFVNPRHAGGRTCTARLKDARRLRQVRAYSARRFGAAAHDAAFGPFYLTLLPGVEHLDRANASGTLTSVLQ